MVIMFHNIARPTSTIQHLKYILVRGCFPPFETAPHRDSSRKFSDERFSRWGRAVFLIWLIWQVRTVAQAGCRHFIVYLGLSCCAISQYLTVGRSVIYMKQKYIPITEAPTEVVGAKGMPICILVYTTHKSTHLPKKGTVTDNNDT